MSRHQIEDLVLAVLLLGLGSLRVAIAVAANEVWEVEPSIALGLVLVGAYLLVSVQKASS